MTMRQDHEVEKVWPKKGTVNHTVLSVNYVSIKPGAKEERKKAVSSPEQLKMGQGQKNDRENNIGLESENVNPSSIAQQPCDIK